MNPVQDCAALLVPLMDKHKAALAAKDARIIQLIQRRQEERALLGEALVWLRQCQIDYWPTDDAGSAMAYRAIWALLEEANKLIEPLRWHWCFACKGPRELVPAGGELRCSGCGRLGEV